MNSKIFGTLTPSDYDYGSRTAFEGKFRAIGTRDSEFTIRGDEDADSLVAWAEEKYRLFNLNLRAVKRSIREWIPEFHEELGFEVASNLDKMLDALEIDTFNFVRKKGGSEIWFYSNVAKGIDDDDEGPLSGHDIVAYFDEKMKVTEIHIDG